MNPLLLLLIRCVECPEVGRRRDPSSAGHRFDPRINQGKTSYKPWRDYADGKNLQPLQSGEFSTS